MFKELEPILETHALTLILTKQPNSKLICVNVIPTKTEKNKSDDTSVLKALQLQPASAADLDEGGNLSEALTSYSTAVRTFQESADQAKAEMEASLQAVKDEAKKKTVTTVKPATTAKAVTPKDDPPTPEPTKAPSLFDTPTADAPTVDATAVQPEVAPRTPAPETNPAGSASATAEPANCLIPSDQSTEDEILAEVKAADGETQSNNIAA
jgi:PRTRC genetic system protein E